ncbi:hypothetical protein BmR1_04g05470 [Babesia microti strain RI]|uniref:Uncharacterized protein n=1 Tax=Babesia microti (strain RI) TaxID=1133968 RepID=I7IH69_BABMR|nr:hypothetical protein BmR1_04g05470 [Babesia microti strain RI]CCF75292.1 hypothetical protein BmR1_04g05470 [Babesia microti strain RI]|eukprot:XP_012649700.1 hypothetical protein BmR1_04g05470 [Babesia microti strain RI]
MEYRSTFTPHNMTRLREHNLLRYDDEYKYIDFDVFKRGNDDFEVYQKSIAHRALSQIKKSKDKLQLLSSGHSTFSLKVLKSLGIDLTNQKIEANSIDQLIPSSNSMKIMHSQLKIWNDLYKNEIKLLPSTILYDKILNISKTISDHVTTTVSKSDRSFHIEEYLNKINNIQPQNRNSVDSVATSRIESNSQNIYLEEQVKLLASINSLLLLDETLNEAQDGNFYYDQLKSFPRDCLISVNINKKDDWSRVKDKRYTLLNFVKQICKGCNFDKTTCGLTLLLFDSFIHIKNDCEYHGNDGAGVSNDAGNNGFSQDYLNKYAVACLMLIAGLREHWTDIKRDSYLENIISAYKSKFTIQEIARCQMEIIKTMPKGFTNIYVPFEYGLFFLSVLRDIEETSQTNENADNCCGSVDDGLGLDCLYSYLRKTCAISWVYSIITKWDELFLYENWNSTITPSRAAAAIFLHIFLDFYQCEGDKNVLWCRRFCSRVFKMLYDCDVGLWYHCIKNQLCIVYMEIAKASDSSWQIYSIFKISSFQWCAQLKLLSVYKAKSLIEYMDSGQKLCGLDYVTIMQIIPRLIQLVIANDSQSNQECLANGATARCNALTSRIYRGDDLLMEEDNTKKRRS